MPNPSVYLAIRQRVAREQLRRAIARWQFVAASEQPGAFRSASAARLTASERAAVDRLDFWRRAL